MYLSKYQIVIFIFISFSNLIFFLCETQLLLLLLVLYNNTHNNSNNILFYWIYHGTQLSYKLDSYGNFFFGMVKETKKNLKLNGKEFLRRLVTSTFFYFWSLQL